MAERTFNRSPIRYLDTSLAVLLAAAVLLPLLGHRPLTDWDEGIYAEIAREMLASHTLQGYLIPHWNGHLWFEKPPLQMWLTAVSLRLFGLTAFAARLPSALAGIAATGMLHAWLARHISRISAWLGTVFLLSAFGFQHAARVSETDTLLSAFCLFATLGLAHLLEGAARGWILFWIGFALALMTKGAASVLLPLTCVVLLCLHPRRMLQHAGTFALGLVLFLAVTLPWHLYLVARFGRAFLGPYLGFHVLQRATGAIEGHSTGPWFYVWVLLISAPPVALLYPFAIAKPLRQPERIALRAPAVFALLGLCLFSVAKTRLPHYIAPLYPPFSLLAAACVSEWLKRDHGVRPRFTQNPWFLAGGALALYSLCAVATGPARRSLHNPRLGNGFYQPDNREAVALLQKARARTQALPPGPLLVWRQGPVVTLTTDAFYSQRLAQQVSPTTPPPGTARNPYFFDPEPLGEALPQPGESRPALVDRSLLTTLPANVSFTVWVEGPTEAVGLLARR
jgi:4-amino-4-deoxy-L-arabinose transferase-like glycosyltransferase